MEGEDGTYVLTYTQWNRKTYSVGIATSPDLTHWTKHGPAFLTAAGGKYAHLKYKSAGIVTRLERTRTASSRRRSMAGTGCTGARAPSTSPPRTIWSTGPPWKTPAVHPVELLRPRAGHFDSTFPETGPPPVLTDAGIVVLYNGKNADKGGDPSMGPERYAAGEALFDARIQTPASRPTSRC